MNSTNQQTPPSKGGWGVSSRVMHMAHSLQQTNPTMTWSEILKLAWHFQYFSDMLRAGIVKFSYVKGKAMGVPPTPHAKATLSVGTPLVIRPARGTLHPELIPEDKKPVGKYPTRAYWGTMAYYDLDRQDWRSFRLDALYNVDAYITLNNVPLTDD